MIKLRLKDIKIIITNYVLNQVDYKNKDEEDDEDVFMGDKGEFDEFCVYKKCFCINCKNILGRYYFSTTKELEDWRG